MDIEPIEMREFLATRPPCSRIAAAARSIRFTLHKGAALLRDADGVHISTMAAAAS